MKNLLLIITLIFALISFSKVYANNDSLTIIELQNEVKNLNLDISELKEHTTNFKEETMFFPTRFVIGLMYKWDFDDDIDLIGLSMKFSKKSWGDYKHYGYIDISIGSVRNDYYPDDWEYVVDYYEYNGVFGASFGYLYNINNYIMVGGNIQLTIPEFSVIPALMVSISNDKFFNDVHFSVGKYGFGMGYSIGMCF